MFVPGLLYRKLGKQQIGKEESIYAFQERLAVVVVSDQLWGDFSFSLSFTDFTSLHYIKQETEDLWESFEGEVVGNFERLVENREGEWWELRFEEGRTLYTPTLPEIEEGKGKITRLKFPDNSFVLTLTEEPWENFRLVSSEPMRMGLSSILLSPPARVSTDFLRSRLWLAMERIKKKIGFL